MTASPGVGLRPGSRRDKEAPAAAPSRPLAVSGAIAASAVTVTGLGILIPLVLAGWIAAPHPGTGLAGVLRTATALWLAAHHVTVTVHGAGRIGMLPLGLLLVPGWLLWRAGRWLVHTAHITRLPEAGFAAAALAAPYGALCGALALAGRSPAAAPSFVQAMVAGLLLALCAGGLGAARAIAPWHQLAHLGRPRPRSLVLGTVGALAVLCAGGAALAAGSLAAHFAGFRALNAALAPGPVGMCLLLLAQLAYVPNAIAWAVCYALGPGFAVGAGTVVAPTGSALGPLPAFPLLAALPAGPGPVPGWALAAVLALPYLAGIAGGILVARAAPTPAIEAAPCWGFAVGAAAGCLTGVLAGFSGGPLGDGRLAEVGPSGWQAALIGALEVGVAAGIAAGIANWLRLRRERASAGGPAPVSPSRRPMPRRAAEQDGHRIYLDPWGQGKPPAGKRPGGGDGRRRGGPSALP